MKEYKLEIYVKQREDLDLIIKLLKQFCFWTPEYEVKRINEFGIVEVEHHHYKFEKKAKK